MKNEKKKREIMISKPKPHNTFYILIYIIFVSLLLFFFITTHKIMIQTTAYETDMKRKCYVLLYKNYQEQMRFNIIR